MSKSIPMLPSLAGGSGVAAHALVDTDLMWVVDAETLDADRDRKVTLAELKAEIVGDIPADVLELQTAVTRLQTYQTSVGSAPYTLPVSGSSGDASLAPMSIPAGSLWVLSGWINYRPTSSGNTITSVRASVDGGSTWVYGSLPTSSTDTRSIVIPETILPVNPTTAYTPTVRMEIAGTGNSEPTFRFTARRIL